MPIEAEHRLLDPATRSDAGVVEDLLHADFVEFGTSGRIWSRAAAIEALQLGSGSAGEPQDMRCDQLADGVALVTYRLAGSLRSSVWLRGPDQRWRIRFHQGTPADAQR